MNKLVRIFTSPRPMPSSSSWKSMCLPRESEVGLDGTPAGRPPGGALKSTTPSAHRAGPGRSFAAPQPRRAELPGAVDDGADHDLSAGDGVIDQVLAFDQHSGVRAVRTFGTEKRQ